MAYYGIFQPLLYEKYKIIKQLNRLANDRSLPPGTRNKVREAAQHIKELNNETQLIKVNDFKDS